MYEIVSQDEFIKGVTDKEKLYNIRVIDRVPYLRADIEYGGDVNL